MEKLDGMSMNVEQAEMEKLKAVFPQCFVEGKLDIDKLLSLCGEYIDNDFEKYKFEWKGKLESLRLAQKRSTGTLRPCREESVNFDDTQNLYIEGDNLEVLKLLQTAYYNRIKMIYIDPPYNTGNDFVYADDFADPMARYKEVTQQATKSNPETMGRYHTNWLNMMYPRLRLAANLLTDDGLIFISIDDNEVTNLKKICDEIFGEENFVSKMVWQSTPGSNTGTNIITVTEYVLVYAKSKTKCTFNTLPISDTEKYIYEDEYVEKRGKYILNKLDRRMTGTHYSEALNYPIEMPDGSLVYPGSTETKSNENWNYRWSKTKVEWGVKNGFIVFKNVDGKWNAYFKQYQKVDNNDNPIDRSLPFQNLIKLEQFGSTQGTKEIMNFFGNKFFDYPKPSGLVKYLINICPDNDITVLDFFSGSATTAQATIQLNQEDGGTRKFICVQLPEALGVDTEAFKAGYKNICEIGKERIRRAGKKILEENAQAQIGDEEKKPLDIGFKVFKLDTSNLKTWDSTPIEEQQIDLFYERLNSMINAVKDDRTDMDVVYEVMLKMGIPLDIPVTYIDVNDKVVYVVGEFLLMICLADKITAEDIEGMAAYAPAKIICAEAGFADDSALSNAHYILRDRAIELKLV